MPLQAFDDAAQALRQCGGRISSDRHRARPTAGSVIRGPGVSTCHGMADGRRARFTGTYTLPHFGLRAMDISC
jgi:hypothetical protein